MPDVLVLGDVVLDVVVHTGGRVLRGTDTDAVITLLPGGAGVNVAAGLAREGLTVTLAGCVGEDGAEAATRSLRENGVELALRTVPGAATGTVVLLVESDGDRSMACDRGANLALQAADVSDNLLRAHRHLHVSGYSLFGPPRAATLDVLARARTLGLTVSLDPASVAPLRSYGTSRFRADTAGCDLLLPNAEEAQALTGASTPAEAALLLATEHTAVAVTCGADGALWAAGTGLTARPARVVILVDTVGAGDSFTAGAVAALLAGADGAGCLERGLTAAARCVAGVGARA